ANPACDGGGNVDGMCMDGGRLRAIVPPAPGELVINEWMANPDVVTDANGEWFEVYVDADVDLNGLELSRISGGNFQLETTLTSADCLSFTAGSHVLFARESDTMVNGGLPAVDFVVSFGLNNSDSGLAVGLGGEHHDEVTWTSSTTAAATKLDPGAQSVAGNDDPANLCDATTPYGTGDNAGTPGDPNSGC
ncbi:MAG: lamin tail domain-containing protein, partial [Deltaproteobacteria bacterium]|nr:lamin tail domain-containing protein [Deltaproteobacteria bacterium]